MAICSLSLSLFASVLWVNRSYVGAFFGNSIGAPPIEETTAHTEPEGDVVVRLAVAGDVGTGDAAAYKTAAVMDRLDQQRDFDALLLLGDNIYENGDPADVVSKVFEPFDPVLDRETQLLAVLGNHDVDDGFGPAQAKALGMANAWYSTSIEDVTIVALDSNQADNPDQLAWLRATLSAVDTTWTIAIMHHPAYSAGWHGSDAKVQKHFAPLFAEFDVDLALSGHDHDYQRNNPIDGVTYVVTGAAAKLRPAGSETFTAVSWSTPSFVDLAVYEDRIELQAVDHSGRSIDVFELSAQ